MPRSDRYTWTAIALHWLIAIVVIVQFKWGWWMQDIPKQPPGGRADAFNLHKSVGLTILALMIVRRSRAYGGAGGAPRRTQRSSPPATRYSFATSAARLS